MPSVVTTSPERSSAGPFCPDEAGVVLVGHEADLLAVGFFGHVVQSQAVGAATDLVFAVRADGEHQSGEDLRPDAPQHVRLILGRIEAAMQADFPVRAGQQPGVMARGDPLGPDAVGVLEQFAEFEPRIAHDARVGRAAGRVFGDEIADNLAELLLEVDGVERDSQAIGHPPGVVGIGGRAAALLAARAGRGRAGGFRGACRAA